MGIFRDGNRNCAGKFSVRFYNIYYRKTTANYFEIPPNFDPFRVQDPEGVKKSILFTTGLDGLFALAHHFDLPEKKTTFTKSIPFLWFFTCDY